MQFFWSERYSYNGFVVELAFNPCARLPSSGTKGSIRFLGVALKVTANMRTGHMLMRRACVSAHVQMPSQDYVPNGGTNSFQCCLEPPECSGSFGLSVALLQVHRYEQHHDDDRRVQADPGAGV
jgi:hypothetical protein